MVPLGHVEVLAQLGHLGAGQMGAQVDGTALEAHQQAVGVFDDLKGHLIQLGRVPQYSSNFSSTTESWAARETNLKGPVPTGSVSCWS